MIDFLTPGDAAAIIEQLADPAIRIVSLTITEGGYFIDPASGKFNPTHPDIVADAQNLGDAEDRVRPDPRRADAPPRRRHRAVHRHVLRQHPPQRPRHRRRRRRARAADRPGARRLGRATTSPFPNGMVDRITPATTDRERGILAERVRHRGQLAGVLRGVQAMGAGGQFPRRPAGAGKGRRAVRAGRRALRADEDPHPQWRPRDDRLSGRADGHPFRPRGDGGAAGARLPRQARARRDHPDRAAGAGHRCSRTISS